MNLPILRGNGVLKHIKFTIKKKKSNTILEIASEL